MIFSCYRMWRNVFGMSSTPWHPMDISALDVRPAFPSKLAHYYLTLAWVCPTLIHPNKWNLKVRRWGSSNHHIFVMLWVDSNHLPSELNVSAPTTYPLNSQSHFSSVGYMIYCLLGLGIIWLFLLNTYSL